MNQDNTAVRFWYEIDPWSLVQDRLEIERNIYMETVMSQSNGYMGIHGYHEESSDDLPSRREGYLAGVFADLSVEATNAFQERKPWPYTAMIAVPEIFNCSITLADEVFDPLGGELVSYRRELDMRTGVLSRWITWKSPKGRTTRLHFERFLSMSDVHTACQRIDVTAVDWSGVMAMEFSIDGRVQTPFRPGPVTLPMYRMQLCYIDQATAETDYVSLRMTSSGTKHPVVVTSAVSRKGENRVGPERQVIQHDHVELKQGETYSVDRFVSIVTGRDVNGSTSPEGKAIDHVGRAVRWGYTRMLNESSLVWQSCWDRVDIRIEGSPQDEKALRYNLFNLIQLAPRHTDRVSLPARGLSHDRYLGVYFWDTEIFLLPFYDFLMPQVGRNLMKFRYHTLAGARQTAQWRGASGAAYPFMADADSGSEQTCDGLARILIHVTADVCYALDQYVRITGDKVFMRDYGLEMLIETSRYWLSLLIEEEGAYHLDGAVGPCEFSQPGRDNAYTNLMVRRNLKLAADWMQYAADHWPDVYQRLCVQLNSDHSEAIRWRDAAERLCIPKVPGTAIPLQDEVLLTKPPADIKGWRLREHPKYWGIEWHEIYQYRVLKQADVVLAMLLLEDEFDREQFKAAYDYYDPMTIHHSSLSRCTSAIISAKLGNVDEAYQYFLETAYLDLADLNEATHDGLHTANMGGAWQAIVFGFAGLRLSNGELTFEPHLPPKWSRIQFKVIYRGTTYAVTVNQDGVSEIVECRPEAVTA